MKPTGTLKAAAILALFSATACVFGDDGAVQRAKQICQARDLAPGSVAYDKCVSEEAEKIYIAWGRDRQFLGLN